ncbi:MAG: DNA/RNA non-specific endonuclease [Bacteroidales bacterium]|nr:DNA/RNA non-specific endonuclease [Bacteroidales bacterium]
MRLSRNIFLVAMLGAVALGCSKVNPASLNLLTINLSFDSAGGSEQISVQTNQNWSVSADQTWVEISPSAGSGSDSYQLVTVSVGENESEQARQATITVRAGELSKLLQLTQAGAPKFTIRDFRAKKADKTTWYKLTGEIASIANEEYGNFYIFDETDYVYVYGLTKDQQSSNDQSFSKLDLKPGDTVTMMTLRSEHNGLVEAGGTIPAYFVSRTAGEYKLGTKVSSTKAGWLELPATSASDGQDLLIHRFPDGSRNYAAYYDYKHFVSTWVAYPLCGGNIGSSGGRTDAFALDPLLPRDKQAYLTGAFREGNAGKFDRGHQIPSADRLETRVNLETFFSTNMTPQLNALNANGWEVLESKVRGWAKKSDTLYVVTGCSVAGSDQYALDSEGKQITVPTGYYKALLRLDKDKNYSALGIWMDHAANSATSIRKDMVMSIDELEKKVGVDFFVNLPEAVQKTVEAQNPADEAWWWNN